jgi:hypothetical protein
MNDAVYHYLVPDLFKASGPIWSSMHRGGGGRRKKFQTKKRNKNRKTKHKMDVINNRKHTRFTKHNRFTKRN